MPYARRYNYQGIEPLWLNVLRILERDLPAELELVRAETESNLLDFAEYQSEWQAQPQFPFIRVEPDEDDAAETDSGLLLAEANQFDILIGVELKDEQGRIRRDLVRYKKAVRNVIWSMNPADVTEGLEVTPPTWAVRGGRYRWADFGNVSGGVVEGMKLIFTYQEVANA